MRNEFTAVVEADRDAGTSRILPKFPAPTAKAGRRRAALKSLANAIALILEDLRRKDGLRGVPASARRERVIVG